jgi:hypothetical protein
MNTKKSRKRTDSQDENRSVSGVGLRSPDQAKEWADVAMESRRRYSDPEVAPPKTSGQKKRCTRCQQMLPIEVFEGFRGCSDCRAKANASWKRVMRVYKKAGVGQRAPLNDDEKSALMRKFHDACAFCGKEHSEERHLRFTRLVSPKDGGGDELFNVIPSCAGCIQSRKGWKDWDDWYKHYSEIWSAVRYKRILAHHNELPIAAVQRVKD